jgi:SRSO17 transposase
VPERWDPASPKATADVRTRRAKAGIPDEIRHREKWRLGLDMLDEMTGWGLTPPLAVADAGYGEIGEFRQGLEDRGVPYVVQVASTVTAYPETATRTTAPYSGNGPHPRAIYRDPAASVKDLILTAGRTAARPLTWRHGSRQRGGKPQPMRSHFVFLRVRPASDAHRRAHRGQDLPVRWLIAEWPPTEPEPTKYWISDLPAHTPRARLIRLAKLRWRIEHDYRELKDGLGLDHFEGRSYLGWHRHVTLTALAQAFCTSLRYDPKAPAPA